MRLAFTSDLHLPITPAETIAEMAAELAEFAPDALVVAGDIGESLADIEKCLSIIRWSVLCPVLVLPGNHDLWPAAGTASERLLPTESHGSCLQRWQEDLPTTVSRAGCHWLEGDAFIAGGVAVAGTIAWYDYSAADPSIEASAETFARQKRSFNNDGVRMDWSWSDPEFAEVVAGPFLATLDRLEAAPTISQTVVVTHVPLLECQMCRRPDNPEWAFSNAYFGNLTLGARVLQRRKVTHIISGHTHIARQQQVCLEDGRTIDARVLAGDYARPAWLGLTLNA